MATTPKHTYQIFIPIIKHPTGGISIGYARHNVKDAMGKHFTHSDIYATQLIGLPPSVERDLETAKKLIENRDELLREVLAEPGLSYEMRQKIMQLLLPGMTRDPIKIEEMKKELERLKADVAKLDRQITLATGGTR